MFNQAGRPKKTLKGSRDYTSNMRAMQYSGGFVFNNREAQKLARAVSQEKVRYVEHLRSETRRRFAWSIRLPYAQCSSLYMNVIRSEINIMLDKSKGGVLVGWTHDLHIHVARRGVGLRSKGQGFATV